jgi:hypothetical protein
MRPLIVFIFLVLTGTSVSTSENPDTQLTYYAESISLDQGGGADVVVRLCAIGFQSGAEVALPYTHASVPDSFVAGSAIREVTVRELFGRRQLFVAASRVVASNDTLEFRFHLAKASAFGAETSEDFGNRVISYRIVQSSPRPVDLMSVRIVLPEGAVINKVLSSSPAGKANSSSSPYILGMSGRRHCITLTDSTVHQGDVVAMEFQAKAGRKSPVLIVGLALIAGVYLFAFRDLLKKANNGTTH